MYIVPDGHVIFENISCDMRDSIQGIFITKRGYTTPVIANSNLSAATRCTDGRLEVQGMLVGPGVTSANFIGARRSVLHNWFNLTQSTQETKIFE